MSKTTNIGGRLHSTEVGNVLVGANEVLDDTKQKKQNVINAEVDAEMVRLDQSKQNNLTFDNAPTEDSTNPVTSGGVYAADKVLSDAIEAILLLIPSAATALNKLADMAFVNSSVSTATATFRGTYNVVTDLELAYDATHEQIATKLGQVISEADNNDYAYVQVPVSATSTDIRRTERYKFNGSAWGYEYDLNTSGFTAAQWNAINSGITAVLVAKLTGLPTAEVLATMFAAKQDTLTFDNAPTALSTNPVTSEGVYSAILAVSTALSDYIEATNPRLFTLEGLVPTEASSSNKLTDKDYVDGLIEDITELIPSDATTSNQLADKAYVLAQILAATPAFKGQFTTLADLQAVVSPKEGDLGIVRTKDNDGKDVFTFYQYLSNAWNVYYTLSYHPQMKPATTGTTGDYPYNGMGRVELPMNIVEGVNTLTQSMMPTATGGNTIYIIRYDFILGEDVTVPANCVLEFEGGSVSGEHTLTGNNTDIQAGLIKIFNTDVTLAGSWNVAEAYPEWFGANGDGTTDDTNAIQKCLYLSYCCNGLECKFTQTYLITDTIYIPFGTKLESNKFGKYSNSNPTFIANLLNPDKIAFDTDVYIDSNFTERYSSSANSIADGDFYAKTNRRGFSLKNIVISSDNNTLLGLRIVANIGGTIDGILIYGTRIGVQITGTWESTICNIILRVLHLGAYLASKVYSESIENFTCIGIDNDVAFTQVEETYFNVPIGWSETYPNAYEQGKSIGIFSKDLQGHLSGLVIERFDFAFILDQSNVVVSGFYIEHIKERMITSRQSSISVNMTYGTQDYDLSIGYCLLGVTSTLEIKNVNNNIKFPVEYNGILYNFDSVTKRCGDSANRFYKSAFDQYYDTDIAKPIWFNGNYWIDSQNERITYPITFDLRNVNLSNVQQPNIGQQYITVATAEDGYVLPATILVQMSGSTLSAGTDYTYDSNPNSANYGQIVVLGSGGTGGITGNLFIRVRATAAT